MTRAAHIADSIDLEAAEIYMTSPEFLDAIFADDFETRCAELFRRLDNGEKFTLAAVGRFLRIRWEAASIAFALFAPSYLPARPGRAGQQ